MAWVQFTSNGVPNGVDDIAVLGPVLLGHWSGLSDLKGYGNFPDGLREMRGRSVTRFPSGTSGKHTEGSSA